MKMKQFWLVGFFSVVFGSHHPQLQGSEGYPLEPQEKFIPYHKPLLSHYLSPLFHHPWAHKLAAISYIKHLKPTITKTKTIVMQTVAHHKKHLVCYKAHHDLPPCIHDAKEGNFILPTSVPDVPHERNTQFLGYLEGSELKQDDQYSLEEDIDREQRHLFGHGFFKSIKYVTKTLWVTRVEDYVDTQVTATLLAANCVPSHDNILPCPEKVEHYVHYDLSHGYKPIHEHDHDDEKNEHHDDKYGHHYRNENARENSKEYVLEDRSGAATFNLTTEKQELPEEPSVKN